MVQRADDPVEHPDRDHTGTTTSNPVSSHLRSEAMGARKPSAAELLGTAEGEGEGAGAGGWRRGACRCGCWRRCGRTVSHRRGLGAVRSRFLPLKSVAYHPVPLGWKPGAVSCLEKLACLHSGHSVSGASDIFCKTSLAKPQALHL